MGRLGLGAVLLVLAATSPLAAAAQPNGAQRVQEQRNGDGSWLRLTETESEAEGQRSLQVDLRPASDQPYAPVLQRRQALADFPNGRWYLHDFDGDGVSEVVEVEYCGAGPNCVQTLFKVNPARKTAWRFLHGGFFTVSRVDDFVVTAGRSSCCSWSHLVYRFPSDERTLTEKDLAYSINVSGPLESDSTTARCVISKPTGKRWVLTKPTNERLLQLCAQYGDDVVINPPDSVPEP